MQTVLLVGTNLFDRNYDRYDRNYDRYDRNYDRYDRNYDRYDRNYDRYDCNYDRNYNRLKIKFLFSFWGNYPFPTIRRLLNKVILSHTYERPIFLNFSSWVLLEGNTCSSPSYTSLRQKPISPAL